MIEIEGKARHLFGPQTRGILEHCYTSNNFVFVATKRCPQELLKSIISSLNSTETEPVPLKTGTSREIFILALPHIDHPQTVIIKKNRHVNGISSEFNPVTVLNEIVANTALSEIVEQLIDSGEILPPRGFNSVSVRTETPLGILVDKRKKDKFTIYNFESDSESGEVLQYTDPPIQGAITYSPRKWELFCAVKDVLDYVVPAALKMGLKMTDYDIHQVLYKVNNNARSLEIILIDSERLKIVKVEKEPQL